MQRIVEQLRADGRWRRRLQIWLVVLGGGLAGLASVGLSTMPDWKLLFAPIVAAGILMTIIGGIVLAFVDRGTPDLIADLLQKEATADEVAAESLRSAAVLERNVLALGEELQLQTDLRSLGDAMLETVEQALAAERPLSLERRNATITKLVDFLKAKRMGLLGFEDEYWTMSVYLMYNDGMLKCLVARRPNEDDERLPHREWASGEGHIGKAFQGPSELVTSDAQEPSQAQFLQAPPGKGLPHDAERYRSIASVPIITGKTKAVGGVTATSNRVGRFTPGSEGPDRVAALRILALSIAVLISAAEQEVGDVG